MIFSDLSGGRLIFSIACFCEPRYQDDYNTGFSSAMAAVGLSYEAWGLSFFENPFMMFMDSHAIFVEDAARLAGSTQFGRGSPVDIKEVTMPGPFYSMLRQEFPGLPMILGRFGHGYRLDVEPGMLEHPYDLHPARIAQQVVQILNGD